MVCLLAERFGWSVEYILGLSPGQIVELTKGMAANDKAGAPPSDTIKVGKKSAKEAKALLAQFQTIKDAGKRGWKGRKEKVKNERLHPVRRPKA
jgi:hypothetical protein